jgi:Fe2+ transport system protein FeoA
MSKEDLKTIADLLPKEKARVVKVSGKVRLRGKLLDMGILPGVVVEMIRVAPLGDPVDIKVKGYHLSLRKSEAAHISVEKI